jgi:hypothetical protein
MLSEDDCGTGNGFKDAFKDGETSSATLPDACPVDTRAAPTTVEFFLTTLPAIEAEDAE